MENIFLIVLILANFYRGKLIFLKMKKVTYCTELDVKRLIFLSGIKLTLAYSEFSLKVIDSYLYIEPYVYLMSFGDGRSNSFFKQEGCMRPHFKFKRLFFTFGFD